MHANTLFINMLKIFRLRPNTFALRFGLYKSFVYIFEIKFILTWAESLMICIFKKYSNLIVYDFVIVVECKQSSFPINRRESFVFFYRFMVGK